MHRIIAAIASGACICSSSGLRGLGGVGKAALAIFEQIEAPHVERVR